MKTLIENVLELRLALKRKCDSLEARVRQRLLLLRQRLKRPSQ